MRELESLDNELKANILSKYPCTMFDYNIKQNVQGKSSKWRWNIFWHYKSRVNLF